MKLYCYSVFDKQVSAFMTPFFCRTDGEAARSFQDACSDGKHQFCLHPEDYFLARLGYVSDDTGALVGNEGGAFRLLDALSCVRIIKE